MNHESYYQENPIRFSKVSAHQVAQYLRSHPDFLLRHENVLSDIEVVHHCGKTASLIEYQVQQLRQKNQALKENIQQTVRIAKDNERLLIAIQRLMLLLLQAKTFYTAVQTLYRCMHQDFQIEHVKLLLVGVQQQPLPFAPIRELITSRPADAALLALTHPTCQPLTHRLQRDLFGEATQQTLGSVALIPLGSELGILALGSPHKDHFSSDQDTLFLQHLGELLALLLPRWLPQA